MLRIFTHNNGSQGLANLREQMEPLVRQMNNRRGIQNLRPIMGSDNGSARLFRNGPRLVLNWGTSAELNNEVGNLVVNETEAVGNATHKLRFFQRINAWNQENENRQVPIPEWTTSRDEAQTWAGTDHLVYARTRLQGHSGEGIVIYRRNEVVERAPLYTKGIVGARREYRVHVVGGKIALVQLKKRRNGAGTATGDADVIRNLDSGWVYAVSDARPSRVVLDAARNAIEAIGLDFGAVDIIAKGRKGNEREAVVLEVNTAPGQRGDTTVTMYARGLAALYAIWVEHNQTQPMTTIKALWRGFNWLNDAELTELLAGEGVGEEQIHAIIRATNEATQIQPATEEEIVAEALEDADDDFAPARAANSGAHVVRNAGIQGAHAHTIIADEAPQAAPNTWFTQNGQQAGIRRRDGQPRVANPFEATIAQRAEPVAMPTRVANVSRLGANDPQNEQFVVFTWNGRREVGVVHTGRGVVYMAGSELPIPVGTVDLIAVVDTEIR